MCADVISVIADLQCNYFPCKCHDCIQNFNSASMTSCAFDNKYQQMTKFDISMCFVSCKTSNLHVSKFLACVIGAVVESHIGGEPHSTSK